MSGAGGAHAAYYRPSEVAHMLRCSEWWVKEQARRRRIPFCWIGGSYLFTNEHIAAIVRLFEVLPREEVPTIHRRGSMTRPASAGDDSGVTPTRLRARPPRRTRRAEQSAA